MGRDDMDNTEKEVNSYFNIDLNSLDVAWLQQPNLFYDAAMELADAKRGLEEGKSALDVLKTELDLKIRLNPAQYSLDKITEGGVQAAIGQNRKYRNAVREIIDAKHNVDIHQAVVNALEHRKSSLENLVKLHGQNYFSKPSSRDNEEAVEELKVRGRKAARKKGEYTPGRGDS